MNMNEAVQKRFGLETEIGKTVEGNETLSSLLSHRSVREFSERTVDSDLMNTLLAAAFSGPSKSDLQQARVIWVQDTALKRAIADLSPGVQDYIARAPEFLVWCADNTLCHRLAELHNVPYSNNHLDQFMNPAVDAAIAMTMFMVAAESKGLACCPVSSIRDTPFKLAELLSIPKFVFPVAGMVLGYPEDNDPGMLSLKLPPAVTVMRNGYHKNPEEVLGLVRDYSVRREAVQPTPPEKRRDRRQGEAPEDYGWDLDKALQYSLPARVDWIDFIRWQGFDI